MKSASSHEPLPLAVALSELIALRGFARVRGDDELHAAWRKVAGDELSSQTRPAGIIRGTLTIDVENAPLLNELSSFMAADLLTGMNKGFPHLNVKKLKFRLSGM